jgi:hypothetical protein
MRIYNTILKYFYNYLVPIFLVFSLMVIAQFNGHTPRANDYFLDFLLRLGISIFFSKYFIILTNDKKIHLERYFNYDDGIFEKVFISFLGFLSGIIMYFITYLILQKFFLFTNITNQIIASICGLINLFPIVFRLPNSRYGYGLIKKRIHK